MTTGTSRGTRSFHGALHGSLTAILWFLGSAMPAMSHAATRFALVIGNNAGLSTEVPLRWAEQDALRFAGILSELGEVAPERVLLLLGRDVQAARLEIARLQGQLEEAHRGGYRTELFVYYSGHGDAANLHLGNSRFQLNELEAKLEALPADAVLSILDACRDNSLSGRQKGARQGPSFDVSVVRNVGPRGRVTISAAGDGEVAQEADSLQSSLFTHHLMSALRGAGDTNGDHEVTLSELYHYIYHRTVVDSHAQTPSVQHPEMRLGLEGEGELVVTSLERARSKLVLDAGLRGDLLVVDDRDGQVVAEVIAHGGTVRTIAVPAGRFRVQRRHNGRLWIGEVSLPWGGNAVVRSDDLDEKYLTAALAKGESVDPMPWSVAAGALVQQSVLGETPAWGGILRVDYRYPRLPVRMFVSLALGHARANNRTVAYRHWETRARVGASYSLSVGPLRVDPSLAVGIVWVEEIATRVEGQRIDRVLGSGGTWRGRTLGPIVTPGLALRVPMAQRWSVVIAGGLDITWLRIARSTENTFSGYGVVGLETAF